MDRLEQLHRWLADRYPEARFSLAPASADASFRRYFRVTFAEAARATLIAMDAPPEQENCRPFLQVAQLLLDAGLNAPRIIEQDLAQGFLLLSDLGSTTYLAALQSAPGDETLPDRLFGAATDALV